MSDKLDEILDMVDCGLHAVNKRGEAKAALRQYIEEKEAEAYLLGWNKRPLKAELKAKTDGGK